MYGRQNGPHRPIQYCMYIHRPASETESDIKSPYTLNKYLFKYPYRAKSIIYLILFTLPPSVLIAFYLPSSPSFRTQVCRFFAGPYWRASSFPYTPPQVPTINVISMFPSDVLYMYYYNPHYGLICVMPLIKVTQPEKNMIQSSQMCSDLMSYYGDGLFFFSF